MMESIREEFFPPQLKNLTSIGSLHKKLSASKVVGSPISRISKFLRFPTWESQDKMIFGCRPSGQAQRIL